MFKAVAIEQMRAIESECDASGVSYTTLMERAGRVICERVKQIMADKTGSDTRITALVGGGNNGGDALVAAALLARETSAAIRIYLLKPRAEDDPLLVGAIEAGCFVAAAADDQRYRVLSNLVQSADLVLDGIFGIGIQLPLRDEAAKQLRVVNAALREAAGRDEEQHSLLYSPTQPQSAAAHPYVLAIDCPSGLDCDTGAAPAEIIPANETITFIAAKRGLFLFPGASSVGILTLSSLGVQGESATLRAVKHAVYGFAEARHDLNVRASDGHKGSFGKVLVVGGSANYTGAPALAARAAGRAGAGLVQIAATGAVSARVHIHVPEGIPLILANDGDDLAADAIDAITPVISGCDAVLIGPGLGQSPGARALVENLLLAEPVSAVKPPFVIDADALNLLSQHDNWWEQLSVNAVLTPHPGEMARLCGMEPSTVQANRWSLALEKAQEWGVMLVLKGANTVIASPDGKLQVVPVNTPALATAGTGDVLAGVIAGLIAQGMSLEKAAVAGVMVHGLAGLISAKQYGTRAVVAPDVSDALGAAFLAVEGR